MRDLTKDELEEYFRFARADTGAGDFHTDQFRLIGDVVINSGMFNVIGMKMAYARDLGIKPGYAAVSLWVSAFQMGRECESRLLTTALKDGKIRG